MNFYTNNHATDGAGALYAKDLYSLNVENSAFEGNGIYYSPEHGVTKTLERQVQKVDGEGNPMVDGDGNPVMETVQTDVTYYQILNENAQGGAIVVDNTYTLLTNTTFFRNSAREGGAVYAIGSKVYMTNVSMVFNFGYDNQTTGAVHLVKSEETGNWSNLHLTNTLFMRNGGGYDIYGEPDVNGNNENVLTFFYSMFSNAAENVSNLVTTTWDYDPFTASWVKLADNDFHYTYRNAVNYTSTFASEDLKYLFVANSATVQQTFYSSNNYITMSRSYGGSSYVPHLILVKDVMHRDVYPFDMLIQPDITNDGKLTPIVQLGSTDKMYFADGRLYDYSGGVNNLLDRDARGYLRYEPVDAAVGEGNWAISPGAFQYDGVAAYIDSVTLGGYTKLQNALDAAGLKSIETGTNVTVKLVDAMITNDNTYNWYNVQVTDDDGDGTVRRFNTGNKTPTSYFALGSSNWGKVTVTIEGTGEHSGIRTPTTYDYYGRAGRTDATSTATLFMITGDADVTFNGITFQGGDSSYADNYASVIRAGVSDNVNELEFWRDHINYLDFTMLNCTVDGSFGYSGAVVLGGFNSVTIKDSTFTNNHAIYSERHGGAVRLFYPGMVTIDPVAVDREQKMNIANNNEDNNGTRTALYHRYTFYRETDASIQIDGCLFEDNSVAHYGELGGNYHAGNGMWGSASYTLYGGAVYIANDTASRRFHANNKYADVLQTNGTYKNLIVERDEYYCDAITSGLNVEIKNTDFIDNWSNRAGGALDVGSAANAVYDNLRFIDN